MGKRHSRNRRWTDGERRRLEKAEAAGKLGSVTAREVRRSADAVKAKRGRLRLPKAPVDPRQDRLPDLAGEGDSE